MSERNSFVVKTSLLFFFVFFSVHPFHFNSFCQSFKWKFESVPEWSDEFKEGNKIDSSKWSFETGGDGWGNKELQYYTNGENLKIEDGKLIISARKQVSHGMEYTSSRIVTRNKSEWQYGRIEIFAKMPHGRGIWPAFWMLPSKGFNSSNSENGEIDILEYVGFEKNVIHFSIHTGAFNRYSGNEKTAEKKISDAENEFHLYRLDWTPYGIRGSVDGKKYFEFLNNGKGHRFWPFDLKFFLIINLAVGGDWGGLNGIDEKIFPATLEVDYVKVYKFIE